MNEINIGIALSDLNLADQPSRLSVPDDLMAYAHRFSNTLQTETTCPLLGATHSAAISMPSIGRWKRQSE